MVTKIKNFSDNIFSRPY